MSGAEILDEKKNHAQFTRFSQFHREGASIHLVNTRTIFDVTEAGKV